MCVLCVVQVRSVCGSTYMLTQDEELWEKNLPPAVEDLLSQAKDPLADRSDRCESYVVLVCSTSKESRKSSFDLQWSPSNPDTNGTEESVLFSEVSSFRNARYNWYILGVGKVRCDLDLAVSY